MITREEQTDFEDEVYETLDKIAELIGVRIPYYPEVYLIDKDTKWESLKLPKDHLEEFERLKRGIYSGLAFHTFNIILQHNVNNIDRRATMGEECGHILHFMLNHPYDFSKNKVSNFSQDSLEEMWGYFCNKLVYPRRRGGFYWKNPLPENATREEVKKIINNFSENESQLAGKIAKQGYGMGRILYEKHRDGEIPMSQIRKWFLKPLDTERKAFDMFYRMRYEILN
jgi:hypothetical protein